MERLGKMSDNVIKLDQRRPKEPEDKRVMCEIVVYADGDTTTWLSDILTDPEQFNWLFAKLAGATGSLFSEKLERTAHE